MTAARDPLSPETQAHSERSRNGVNRGRWDAYRAERVAAGLPPLRSYETGRRPPFIEDPEVEAAWLASAVRLGLIGEGTSRTEARKIAERLSRADTRRLAAEATATGDDALLAEYHAAERERWEKSADRNERFARLHREYAREEAYKLGVVQARLNGKARS